MHNTVKRPSVADRARSTHERGEVVFFALALTGILAVGGSLAYLLTETNEVVNEFAPTEVTCAVEEPNYDDAVKTNVKVRNTGDVNAYIRAAVIVNWVDKNGNVLGVEPVKGADYEISFASDTGWTECVDGFFYYGSAVPAGTGDASLTNILISSCKQSKSAPVDGYYLSVEILCSAIQAEGVNGSGTPAVVDAWHTEANGLSVTNGSVAVTPKA